MVVCTPETHVKHVYNADRAEGPQSTEHEVCGPVLTFGNRPLLHSDIGVQSQPIFQLRFQLN